MRTPIVNRWSLLLLLGVSVAGCVVVPYKPPAAASHDRDTVLDASRTVLTLGPRTQIEALSETIRDLDRAVVVVPPQEFLDVAFTDGNVTLARMLDPETCARVRDRLGTDYLVLVGIATRSTLDRKGGVVFYIGFFGATSTTEIATSQATLVDLRNAQQLGNVSSRAEGKSGGVGLFYGLFVHPMTETSAREELARAVVAAIRERAGPGPLRIAVLAAEPGSAPAPPPIEVPD